MKKRFLSGLLAALMLTAFLPVLACAANLPTTDEAAQVLSALDIMTGNENGDLMLGNTVTRAEFTKLCVAASSFRDSVGPETATAPYPDVPRTHWAAGYIQAAVQNSLVRGDLFGNFQPSREITLAEAATMALRLLGYQDGDFTGAHFAGQMALYKTLALDDGVTAATSTATITRQDALYLFYNLLTAKTKAGQVYLTVLKPTQALITPAGEIDLVALVNSAMEGPLVAAGDWTGTLPFPLSAAKVYRSGVLTQASALQPNDVVYYSKPMRTLWAYSNKATGTIGAITPASAPTGVTVAGKSYGIETTAAAYALSDLGPYRVGDTVTLLLGRDGKVVAVLPPAQAEKDIVGLVTAVKSDPYTDADGNAYTASTLSIASTDGMTYSYRWDKKNFKEGALVRVTTAADGVQVAALSAAALTGKMSTDGTKLGSHPIADNVEILDTFGDVSALRVYPTRLSGVTLTDKMVRWHELNAQGEVSKLVLNDVTGDLHQYGVLTSVSEQSLAMTIMSSYTYDVGGVSSTMPGSKIYNVKTGPFMMRLDGAKLDHIGNLTELKSVTVDGSTATAASRKYTLSDTVAVYEVRDKKYYLSSLTAVSGGGFALTGWYDKAENLGGRVRVITAKVS